MAAEMESPVELVFHTLCALSFLETTSPHKELQLSDRQVQKGVAEISNEDPMTTLSTKGASARPILRVALKWS